LRHNTVTRYIGTTNFRHDQDDCTGVLLVNLGTTEAPTRDAVRRYLAEFLWDPRVIEMPRPVWWLILHGIILRLRPGRVARAYESIWGEEGSPLLAISRRLAERLQQKLSTGASQRIEVALAMRYGQPSIDSALQTLRERGMRRLLVLPMYPQYSASTTASVFDEVARVLSGWRWVPELRFIQHYHDHPKYIEALAASVRVHWRENPRPNKLMMSFHGIPKRYFLAGDPYFCECQKTGRLLAEALELGEDQWLLSFQSRVGREEWLKPYTDKTLAEWGRQKLGRVDVICPGFSVDCLETLEEIAQQDRELFQARGGRDFAYIPALNDSSAHLQFLGSLIMEHMQGWEQPAQADSVEHRQATQRRAQAMGAKH
jgi:ferrochelatase